MGNCLYVPLGRDPVVSSHSPNAAGKGTADGCGSEHVMSHAEGTTLVKNSAEEVGIRLSVAWVAFPSLL